VVPPENSFKSLKLWTKLWVENGQNQSCSICCELRWQWRGLSSKNHSFGNWKRGPALLKKKITEQLIPVVFNPKFAMGEGGRVPGNWKKGPAPNCSIIEHNWSKVDARSSEPKIRNGVRAGVFPAPTIFGGKGPTQLKTIATQMEHNLLSLLWTPNSKWEGAGKWTSLKNLVNF